MRKGVLSAFIVAVVAVVPATAIARPHQRPHHQHHGAAHAHKADKGSVFICAIGNICPGNNPKPGCNFNIVGRDLPASGTFTISTQPGKVVVLTGVFTYNPVTGGAQVIAGPIDGAALIAAAHGATQFKLSVEDGKGDKQKVFKLNCPGVPEMDVSKLANPLTQVAPGGTFTFTVAVSNPSTTRPVTITTLTDDIYGDLATRPGSTCGALIGVTLAPSATSASCSFTGPFTGKAGDSQTDTVTVTGQSCPPPPHPEMAGQASPTPCTTVTATATATVTLVALPIPPIPPVPPTTPPVPPTTPPIPPATPPIPPATPPLAPATPPVPLGTPASPPPAPVGPPQGPAAGRRPAASRGGVKGAHNNSRRAHRHVGVTG